MFVLGYMFKKYRTSIEFTDRKGVIAFENRVYDTSDLEEIKEDFSKIYPLEYWDIVSIETQEIVEEHDPELCLEEK